MREVEVEVVVLTIGLLLSTMWAEPVAKSAAPDPRALQLLLSLSR